MTDVLYNLGFSGRCIDGADPAAVCPALAQLLKIDEAKLKPLFAGKRAIIKKNLTLDQAKAFKAAFEKVGAVAEVSLSQEGAENLAGTASSETSEAPEAAAPAPSAEGALSMAEPGAILAPYVTPEVPEYDLSAYELADVGVDLVEYQRVPPPDFDLSGLSLDPLP